MLPVLFEIPTPWGEVPIYSYGVMLGLSLVVAWYLVMYLGTRREALSRDAMANAFIITAVAAIVCSRLLYIVTNPQEFEDLRRWFALTSGGLVAYGGFLGGLLGSWLYWRRVPGGSLLAWADVCAPALGLGLMFTRIGCYLFGCDFGAPLADDAPSWLRDLGTFPRWSDGTGSPAFVHHVAEYELASTAHHSLAVHPTQLYESMVGLLLFGVGMLVWTRRRFRGQVILTITLCYALWRFFIEYVRDDPERGTYFGFSTSQLISLLLIPIALLLYQGLRKQQGDRPLVIERAPEPQEKGLPPVPTGREPTGARKKKRKKA